MWNSYYQKGLSLVEALIAIIVTSIVIGASVASYSIVSSTYQKQSNLIDINNNSRQSLTGLIQDIRNAGYVEYQTNHGALTDFISIESDPNYSCCKKIEVTYDQNKKDRITVSYFVKPNSNQSYDLIRSSQVLRKEGSITNSQPKIDLTVAKNIDVFQLNGLDAQGKTTSVNNNIKTIDIYGVFRSKSEFFNQVSLFDTVIVNKKYSFNDKFFRGNFTTSVSLRNTLTASSAVVFPKLKDAFGREIDKVEDIFSNCWVFKSANYPDKWMQFMTRSTKGAYVDWGCGSNNNNVNAQQMVGYLSMTFRYHKVDQYVNVSTNSTGNDPNAIVIDVVLTATDGITKKNYSFTINSLR